MNPKRVRVLIGVLLWAGVVVAGLRGHLTPEGKAADAAGRVLDFVATAPRVIEVVLPRDRDLRAGDPVFVADEERFLVPVGRVRDVEDGVARILVFPEEGDLLREGLRAEVYAVPDTVAWVVATLLPPEKLEEIRGMTADFYRREGDAIRAALMPEVKKGLDEVVRLYQEDLPAAFARHEEEIMRIVRRHREGVIEAELVPVLRRVGGEIAAEKFRPLAEEVGKELLESLPVWSLGWRYLWEKVPFTEREQMKSRFEEYLRKQAGPILEARTEEAIRLTGEVAQELIAHSDVKRAATAVAKVVVDDPEVKALVRTLFDELVLENDRLTETLRRRWESGLKDAVGRAASRTEPLVKKILDAVVLTPDRRLAPRFSHVLRTRVFWKDRRWILLTGGAGEPLADGARIEGTTPDE